MNFIFFHEHNVTFLELHYSELFPKYDAQSLLKDIHNFKHGKGKLGKLIRHFFKERIYECHGTRGRVSPMEAMQNEEIMKKVLAYIHEHPSFYCHKPLANVESFFRNGGKYASKVGNFCPKTARSIYERYRNGRHSLNILDTSMGFGSRMLGALLSGHSYYGIDPNKKLNESLHDCLQFLKDNNQLESSQECMLYCQGSETFIPALENKCDVMFTSPPYFNLEIYSEDECESTKNYDNYENWLERFVKPTVDNITRYMRKGGIVMINIKNMTRNARKPLFDDWMKIMKDHPSLEYLETFEISHQTPRHYREENQYKGFKEPVMVFRKI